MALRSTTMRMPCTQPPTTGCDHQGGASACSAPSPPCLGPPFPRLCSHTHAFVGVSQLVGPKRVRMAPAARAGPSCRSHCLTKPALCAAHCAPRDEPVPASRPTQRDDQVRTQCAAPFFTRICCFFPSRIDLKRLSFVRRPWHCLHLLACGLSREVCVCVCVCVSVC